MKLKLLEMVLKALLELILDLVKKSAEDEKLHDEERVKLMADIALADATRKAYPSLSDEKIIKELC
jgi:hypothetical protein